MEYRNLGRSGLMVSPLCIGTMMFGGLTNKKTADAILGSARDAGINFIDTANSYGRGKSEKMIGELIAKDRDNWVLATKGASRLGPGPYDGGVSRKGLMKFLDDSLKRLKTDYIDLYYLHKDEEHRGVEEAVATVGDMLRAGKIRYWGISNYRGWRHAEIVHTADRLGVPRPAASQPYYNAMNRMPENDILPACAHHGIGVVPYSPLARGVLTGKYDPRGHAGQELPRRTRRSAHDGNRISSRVAEDGTENSEACRSARYVPRFRLRSCGCSITRPSRRRLPVPGRSSTGNPISISSNTNLRRKTKR